jgi:hypothetical protein
MRLPLSGVHSRAASTLQDSGPCPDLPVEPPICYSLWAALLAGLLGKLLLAARRRRRSRAGMVDEDAVGSCAFLLFMLLVIVGVCVLPTMLQGVR